MGEARGVQFTRERLSRWRERGRGADLWGGGRSLVVEVVGDGWGRPVVGWASLTPWSTGTGTGTPSPRGSPGVTVGGPGGGRHRPTPTTPRWRPTSTTGTCSEYNSRAGLNYLWCKYLVWNLIPDKNIEVHERARGEASQVSRQQRIVQISFSAIRKSVDSCLVSSPSRLINIKPWSWPPMEESMTDYDYKTVWVLSTLFYALLFYKYFLIIKKNPLKILG